MSKLAKKLVEMCVSKDMGISGKPEDYVLQRTYAGYWQRGHGAWSWSLTNLKTYHELCGSQWPATVCVRNGFTILSTHGGSELLPNDLNPRT